MFEKYNSKRRGIGQNFWSSSLGYTTCCKQTYFLEELKNRNIDVH
jgi:hypothetical protein